MSRYFVALLPPEPNQVAVNVIKQQFADQYHSRKAFNAPPHITLQPPFHWPVHEDGPQLEDLCLRLSAFASSRAPVPITLRGFAAFSNRVIYVNVLPTPRLMSLQQNLASLFASEWQIIDQAGLTRQFTPHITVAFRDLTPANFEAAWPLFEQAAFDDQFTVPKLTLLGHDGQAWQPLRSFHFGS